jgi:RNA polymerase sigma factor (sigma-70 family)
MENEYVYSLILWNLINVRLNRNHHIEDQELLENFYQDHDNQWLGMLFPRYTMLLLGVCMKYLRNEEEAKDAVQQVFLKALSELHKYRVEYFKSWIYMVAKNHCLMKLRNKNKYSVEINERFMTAAPDDKQAQLELLEKDQLLTEMEQSLKDLNHEQQLCVTLFYLNKKSYVEIAEETGYSMMQVKSYIQNGKRNLKIA